jgi:ribosomal protein L9
MELLDTFIPPTIDFARQRIEQEKDAKPRYGASGAADVLTAAAMGTKSKVSSNAIYGSVSTADIAATLKAGLAHNDEAARVIVNEADIRFVDGTEDGDAQRVKELGVFKVEIQLPGATEPLVRNIRVKAKDMDA